jgi:hypothetical protein
MDFVDHKNGFINWLDDFDVILSYFFLKKNEEESSFRWLIWEKRRAFLFSLCSEDKCVFLS